MRITDIRCFLLEAEQPVHRYPLAQRAHGLA